MLKKLEKLFEENALIKAKTIAQVTKLPTIADDSGLSIKCLDNFPGVKTARIFPQENNYEEKCKKMIKLVDQENKDRKLLLVLFVYIILMKINTIYLKEKLLAKF